MKYKLKPRLILLATILILLAFHIGADEETRYPDGTVYPSVPQRFGKCRVIINELALGSAGNSKEQFVELKLVCPDKRARITDFTLKDYKLWFLRGDTGLDLAMDLSTYQLGDLDSVNKRYFVCGESGLDVLLVDTTPPTVVGRKTFMGIEPGVSYAVALLYSKKASTDEQILLEEAEIKRRTGNVALSDSLLKATRSALQDIVFYSIGSTVAKWDKPEKFWDAFLELPNDFTLRAPQVTNTRKSFSRCTDSSLPFRPFSFKVAISSPKQNNHCNNDNAFVTTGNSMSTPNKITPSFPYSFGGVAFQHQATQFIVNLHTFFTLAKKTAGLLNGSPRELAARALNINIKTVSKAIQRHYEGDVATPTKGIIRLPYTIKTFDTFDHDMIRRIITGFYQRNEAPHFLDIFKKFLQSVRENRATQQASGGAGNTNNQGSASANTRICSSRTFNKLLKILGYKYGKIGQRDAVLQRADIVAWRANFIKTLKENERSANPREVIYTDETWVDPHGRLGKGWVRKTYKSNKEKAEFTYKSNKISRGPRIIILNAVNSTHLINEVMEVYTVKKSKVKEDYHENVDGITFEKWFDKLLSKLTKPSIIVIDNAPYHSVSTAPKSNARKQELYDWLQKEKIGDPTLPFTLPQVNQILRAELLELVRNCKKLKSYYKVDIEAKRKGHILLRLPPYNCDLNPIEFIWKDIKHEIKKSNRDQNLNTMQQIARTVMENYPTATLQSHFQHVKKLREEYEKEDGAVDSAISANKIIITQEDDDDEEAFEGFSSVHDIEIEVDDDEEELETQGASQSGNPPARKRLCYEENV